MQNLNIDALRTSRDNGIVIAEDEVKVNPWNYGEDVTGRYKLQILISEQEDNKDRKFYKLNEIACLPAHLLRCIKGRIR